MQATSGSDAIGWLGADAVLRPKTVEPVTLEQVARSVGIRPNRTSDTQTSATRNSQTGTSQTGTSAEVLITGVSAHSAFIRPGDLYAALPGAHGHGADFLQRARGAVAVLTDEAGRAAAAATGLPCFVVGDPRAVLGPLAATIYGEPSVSLPVLGITGTSGKTTTSWLLRAGLAAAGRKTGLIGTIGVFLGTETIKTPFTTPEAPELQALFAVMAERGLTEVVMEVSSHALALHRVDGTRFAVGAFTNLSRDHLDFHRDMADYFAAKSLLFDGRAAREVVSVDDDWGRQLIKPGTVTVRTDPTVASADWTADQVRTLPDGSMSFRVSGPGLRFEAGCAIAGGYNVANTVLALACLHSVGVDPASVAAEVARVQVPGRMQRIDGDQPFLAVVDYSHKPAGVAGALAALRSLTPGRLIVVLGCGGDRDRGKRPLMGQVAAERADVLVVTDDNPRSEDPALIRAAMLGGARSVPEDRRAELIEDGDRAAAIARAISGAEAGDTVLVAGKGHETGQQVGEAMLPFDDVSVTVAAMTRRGFTVSASSSPIPSR